MEQKTYDNDLISAIITFKTKSTSLVMEKYTFFDRVTWENTKFTMNHTFYDVVIQTKIT